MRKAVDNTPWSGKFHTIGHHCQDYVSAVMKNYNDLGEESQYKRVFPLRQVIRLNRHFDNCVDHQWRFGSRELC